MGRRFDSGLRHHFPLRGSIEHQRISTPTERGLIWGTLSPGEIFLKVKSPSLSGEAAQQEVRNWEHQICSETAICLRQQTTRSENSFNTAPATSAMSHAVPARD